MTKAITYTSFAAASLLVVYAFLTAQSYTQLTVAVILFPALAYFALKVFPRNPQHGTSATVSIPAIPIRRVEEVRTERVDVVDLDKRTFLKLVGTVGVSFFVFSLLGRKVGDMLFGGAAAPNTATSQSSAANGLNNPGPTSPGSGYNVTEIDENVVSYYGFTNKEGGWLIMREDTQTNSFRYAKGNSGFPNNWSNRENLKYDYYYNLF